MNIAPNENWKLLEEMLEDRKSDVVNTILRSLQSFITTLPLLQALEKPLTSLHLSVNV